MALLVIKVITKFDLTLCTGLGEVTEKGRPFLGHRMSSDEDFSAYLTNRTRACTRVVPQWLKESG